MTLTDAPEVFVECVECRGEGVISTSIWVLIEYLNGATAGCLIIVISFIICAAVERSGT